jgi:3-oxoacyl-[acyl-carrier protein] reductase
VTSNDVRVAMVTGGSRGMGLAIARRLLADGYAILAIDINTRALGGEAFQAVRKEHEGRFDGYEGSVTDFEAMRAAAAQCKERWGGLDVLVNNAGLNRPGGMFDLDEADWDAVVAVNLKGAWLCALASVPLMEERGGGAIVSIGSVAGAGMGSGSPVYAATKAGLVGFTKTIAHELGPRGIRANLVAPGLTLTEWVERNMGEERIAEARRHSPLRRVGEPSDVAAAVAWLASEDARHVTGQVISVSGGEWMP